MTAVAALALLLLVPGLLVVRAPWTAVPALSLAFWALSPWWCPATLSRAGFVGGALLGSLALLVLRLLPKHEQPAPPGWPAPAPGPSAARPSPPLRGRPGLAIAMVALALVVPAAAWRNPPGERLAFQATAARLVLWRDGIPLSSEPLLPIDHFGAHAPALATLAADVARLSGAPPAGAVVLVLVAGAGLALPGLFALLATRLPAPAAASGALRGLAVVAVALALAPGPLQRQGAGETLVALAFVLPCAALLLGHSSRSSGVAAAWLGAAGLLVRPAPTLVALAACAPFAGRRRGPAVALGALSLAAPGLARLAGALSPREALLALRAALSAEALPLAAVALAAVALAAAARRERRPQRLPLPPRGVVAAVALVAALHAWVARGQLPSGLWRELARVEESTRPLEVACADARLVDWVPAVAGRAAAGPAPWLPAAYAEEWAARQPRPCPPGR